MEILESRKALAERAKEARMKSKETQMEASKRFKVHPQTISDAESKIDRKMDKIRVRMIEEYEQVEIVPLWGISPKTQNAVQS